MPYILILEVRHSARTTGQGLTIHSYNFTDYGSVSLASVDIALDLGLLTAITRGFGWPGLFGKDILDYFSLTTALLLHRGRHRNNSVLRDRCRCKELKVQPVVASPSSFLALVRGEQ